MDRWGTKVNIQNTTVKHEYVFARTADSFGNLIRQFGDMCGPLQGSLHIPVDGSLTNLPVRDNFQTDQDWVSAYTQSLQDMVGMSRFPVKVFGLERDQPKMDGHRELTLSRNPDAKERYYTNMYGHPVAYYEPSRLSEPYYLLRRMTDVLSDILHFGSKPDEDIANSSYEDRSDLIAGFLGLGLVRIKRNDASEIRDAALMRSTLLFLRAKKYTVEQIETIYGNILRREYSGLFDRALSQIKSRDVQSAA